MVEHQYLLDQCYRIVILYKVIIIIHNSKPLSKHSVQSYHAYRKYYSIKNSTWPTMYIYVCSKNKTDKSCLYMVNVLYGYKIGCFRPVYNLMQISYSGSSYA